MDDNCTVIIYLKNGKDAPHFTMNSVEAEALIYNYRNHLDGKYKSKFISVNGCYTFGIFDPSDISGIFTRKIVRQNDYGSP